MISAGQPILGVTETAYVMEALTSSRLTMGPFVERFETEFAATLGTKHAIAVMNGTAALHLALAALGIHAGDEVIVPALTFVATANAVAYTGAKPVVVDVDPQTWTLDPKATAAAITARTRAILPVHLYGVPADMNPIREVAREHTLFVVEDAAEALGALYCGEVVGAMGNAACFSFYGNKTITTGEGGMVTTNHDGLAARLRLLRGQGQTSRRYWHDTLGYNYRMTDIQAAIGCAQLGQLGAFLAHRGEVAEAYRIGLRGVKLQACPQTSVHGHWAIAGLLSESRDRDKEIERLAEAGIETRPVFYPLGALPMYREYEGKTPVAAEIARRGIVLPTHNGLSGEDVAYVCEVVNG